MVTVMERPMALETEIETFERLKPELERHHMGKFVLIKGDELIGAYDTLDAVAQVAVPRFGRGPYLIRLVGEQSTSLPASVMTYGARQTYASR